MVAQKKRITTPTQPQTMVLKRRSGITNFRKEKKKKPKFITLDEKYLGFFGFQKKLNDRETDGLVHKEMLVAKELVKVARGIPRFGKELEDIYVPQTRFLQMVKHVQRKGPYLNPFCQIGKWHRTITANENCEFVMIDFKIGFKKLEMKLTPIQQVIFDKETKRTAFFLRAEFPPEDD